MDRLAAPVSRLANDYARFSAGDTSSSAPADVFEFVAAHPEASARELADVVAVDQQLRWETGWPLAVEEYFRRLPLVAQSDELKVRLIVQEFSLAKQHRGKLRIAEVFWRFPDVHEQVLERLAESGFESDIYAEFEATRVVGESTDDSHEPDAGSRTAEPASHPTMIGRYPVIELLGEGTFGRVYRAVDPTLERHVAIKIPKNDLLLPAAAWEKFLAEARILARLERPGIVPVHDAGTDDEVGFFLVSKFVDGYDLLSAVEQMRLSITRCVEIIARVAEALQAAHCAHVIHRDIKPANILLDKSGEVFVADFGIAIDDQQSSEAQAFGTLAYMSPEQSRGEGHLLDGRSDVFSVGVVLYELLTGHPPFGKQGIARAGDVDLVPAHVAGRNVPGELSRICSKALAPRASDRYATAQLMADDLRHWLAFQSAKAGTSIDRQPPGGDLQIVPRGLRSFDHRDADVFLKLLPGPRDRDGIPESLRFWKDRIESRDSDSFRVGLIYGPSGCGKSSFIQAGLLPKLGAQITTLYVECSSESPESTLLQKLRRSVPGLPQDLDLVRTVAAVRLRGRAEAGRKLLIVLDQFEQWLQHHRSDEADALVNALRQCDGASVQFLIGVRDDFWMKVSSLFREIEVQLDPNANIACIDRFSLRHARRILILFGQAFQAFPPPQAPLGRDQERFVDEVIAELADDDRIVPAQLALFAEMMQDKPWSSANLRRIGGASGIGVAFLEEAFDAPAARPNCRRHARAARAVLERLLPESGGDIRGESRSRDDLLGVSGYVERPADFTELLRLLDTELRLITPTESGGAGAAPLEHEAYQLTHDFFVPAIRDWLLWGKKQTARGRAEIRLAERAALWSARRDNASLPPSWEWLSVELLARKSAKIKDAKRRDMLRAARRYFMTMACIIVLVGTGALGIGIDRLRAYRAENLVASLKIARTSDVPALAGSLEPYMSQAEPRLRSILADVDTQPIHRLHAMLSLLSVDPTLAPQIADALVEMPPSRVVASDFITVRDWLAEHCQAPQIRAQVAELLSAKLRDDRGPDPQRLKAGVALAAFGDCDAAAAAILRPQDSVAWLARSAVDDAATNPVNAVAWVGGLQPVKASLMKPLETIFREGAGTQRELAATFLADYVADDIKRLVPLLLEATPSQHRILFAKLEARRTEAIAVLEAIVKEQSSEEDALQAARRRAHAVSLLCELGDSAPVSKMLQQRPDPTESTYLVERLSALPETAPTLLEQLQLENTPACRALLLQALGGMRRDDLSRSQQDQCVSLFASLWGDADAGVHSAAGWALRAWGAQEPDVVGPGHNGPSQTGNWYVSPQGLPMIVFRGEIESHVGSPEDEQGRDQDEQPVVRVIQRDFAISATEITQAQSGRITGNWGHLPAFPDFPMVAISWHWAADYCNQLSKAEGIASDQWCYDESPTHDPQADYLHRTGYRLLTEAEWEHACRAGSSTPFSWGSDLALRGNYAWHTYDPNTRVQPVGRLRPNLFGLFDMHGNAGEWLHDLLDSTNKEADGPDIEKHPTSPDTMRIVRGYSENDDPVIVLRSASQTNVEPSAVRIQIGFRIGRTLPPRE